jgi:hypothetical protein
VAARQGAPVLGVLCSRPESKASRRGATSKPGKERWEVAVGYRWLPSHRHFVGTIEQKQRAILGTEIVNKTHIWDVSASYLISPRWSINTSIPIIKTHRAQLYNPRGDFNVFSQGDMTFGFRTWIFRPPSEALSNIGVGVGVKLPTGRFRVAGPALNAQNQRIIATADQSIQPGDGGTGITFDIHAYTPTYFGSWLYGQGTYLANPRNTNGVSTFRARPLESTFSVTDQYLVRGGVTRLIPGLRKVAGSIGMRLEGVPIRDIIGRSDGFRRPGYSLSVDPGVMFSRGAYTVSMNLPIAVLRNRKQSWTDKMVGIRGDAAFADYSLIMGISRRF